MSMSGDLDGSRWETAGLVSLCLGRRSARSQTSDASGEAGPGAERSASTARGPVPGAGAGRGRDSSPAHPGRCGGGARRAGAPDAAGRSRAGPGDKISAWRPRPPSAAGPEPELPRTAGSGTPAQSRGGDGQVRPGHPTGGDLTAASPRDAPFAPWTPKLQPRGAALGQEPSGGATSRRRQRLRKSPKALGAQRATTDGAIRDLKAAGGREMCAREGVRGRCATPAAPGAGPRGELEGAAVSGSLLRRRRQRAGTRGARLVVADPSVATRSRGEADLGGAAPRSIRGVFSTIAPSRKVFCLILKVGVRAGSGGLCARG